jgi:uncharacterized protein (TIGR00251 family)
MFTITEKPYGLVFKVFVQPRSSENIIAGIYGDALKIRITAPPVAGAANKACLKFLAKSLSLPIRSLEILSGHSGRSKQVLIRYKDISVAESEKKRIKKMVMNLSPNP